MVATEAPWASPCLGGLLLISHPPPIRHLHVPPSSTAGPDSALSSQFIVFLKTRLGKESWVSEWSTRPRKSHIGTKLIFPVLSGRGPNLTTGLKWKGTHSFFFFLSTSHMAMLRTAEAAACLGVTTGHRAGRARRWERERLRAQKPQSQKCF